ncbi:MAG: lipoyl(octanoyl) transferase LipB [Bacteroidales bacterium]|nr:lipoyl(octanoyl) transferase LipB [Bacteroidales bacterium]
MEPTVETRWQDLGLIDYKKAWNKQLELFHSILEAKEKGMDSHNELLFCEHPHVYTLGKNGFRKNLLIGDDMLKQKNIGFYQIERGGDITYHGPGQVVGYPIFDLEKLNFSPKEFVFGIESIIIRVLKHYGLHASRIEHAAGVWLDAVHPAKARKIAAVGFRIHRKVSMHGFALNVNTDLDYFKLIVPCGIADKGVTSMRKELGKAIDPQEVKEYILQEFETLFNVKMIS